MWLMENRYHKVVGLDPVLNWSRKKCSWPRSGLNWSTLAKKQKKKNKKKKTVVFITKIKNQEYHVNLHLLLIFLISMVPHLRGQREQSSFLWFSQKLRVKYRTCMVADKNTDHLRTLTRGLTDLLTIHGLHNKIRTNYSRISWQTTDLQFTDLTKHGPIIHGLDKAWNVI